MLFGQIRQIETNKNGQVVVHAVAENGAYEIAITGTFTKEEVALMEPLSYDQLYNFCNVFEHEGSIYFAHLYPSRLGGWE